MTIIISRRKKWEQKNTQNKQKKFNNFDHERRTINKGREVFFFAVAVAHWAFNLRFRCG